MRKNIKTSLLFAPSSRVTSSQWEGRSFTLGKKSSGPVSNTFIPNFPKAVIFDFATLEDFMSPQIVMTKFSNFPNSSLIVKRSSND
jgi:hypothetical protein